MGNEQQRTASTTNPDPPQQPLAHADTDDAGAAAADAAAVDPVDLLLASPVPPPPAPPPPPPPLSSAPSLGSLLPWSSAAPTAPGGPGASPVKRPQNDNSVLPQLDERAIAEIYRFMADGGFYFSYAYDLTNALQRQSYGANAVRPRIGIGCTVKGHAKKSAAADWVFFFFFFLVVVVVGIVSCHADKQLDKRFWWNRFMLSDFVKLGLQRYMLPLIQGYVYIKVCLCKEAIKEKEQQLLMALLSFFFCCTSPARFWRAV